MGRMIDQTGLNERLQQHARRSGMMVGLSMALAIALILGAFVWIFVRLDPLLSDFTGRDRLPQVPLLLPGGRGASPTVAAEAVPAPAATPTTPGTAEATPIPPPPTAAATAAPTAPAFVTTHLVNSNNPQALMRSAPSTSAAVTARLATGTKLAYANEEIQADGITWFKFVSERGEEGWIRSFDIAPAE